LFVALQYVSGAAWSVAFRRVPEAMAAVIPVPAVGLVLILFATSGLYRHAHSLAELALIHNKVHDLWFDRLFFLTRALVYVAAWIALSRAIVRTSRRQDETANPAFTEVNTRLSALFLVVFGVTFWLASEDWLMTLEPEWSSTVFSLYQFSGVMLGGLAGVIILATWLKSLGPFRRVLSPDHLHDLGKLLFGFSSFWMYVWFCQYMLIWYVNIPEETSWVRRRTEGEWLPLLLVNIILNWGIPFLVLLPRATKRSPGILVTVAIIVLVGRWLDLYLVILPGSGGRPLASIAWELGVLCGAVGLFTYLFFRALARAALVPRGDPYLGDSLPTSDEIGAATGSARYARA
jgi:hypothetical protein